MKIKEVDIVLGSLSVSLALKCPYAELFTVLDPPPLTYYLALA